MSAADAPTALMANIETISASCLFTKIPEIKNCKLQPIGHIPGIMM
jgi:hypothetical protein